MCSMPITYEMPDPTITFEEMYDYGYRYDGMLPLNRDKAMALFGYVDIYLLFDDNTERMAWTRNEIREHDGIFGVENKAWMLHSDIERWISELDDDDEE